MVLNVLVLIFAIDWLSKRVRLWAIGTGTTCDQGMSKRLTEAPTIHAEAEVGADVTLGRWKKKTPGGWGGRQTTMSACEMGDYSYICAYGQVIWTTIGKWTNSPNMVRLNPGNHPDMAGLPASRALPGQHVRLRRGRGGILRVAPRPLGHRRGMTSGSGMASPFWRVSASAPGAVVGDRRGGDQARGGPYSHVAGVPARADPAAVHPRAEDR